MPLRERAIDRASRRGRSLLVGLGEEARRARLERGLTQAFVARTVGLSRNQIRLIEHGEALRVPLFDLGRVLGAVGLELSARAYPSGTPVRDAAHLGLLQRLRQRVPCSAAWAFEAPLPEDRDQRAWDAVVTLNQVRIGVEAETRLTDVQSVLRRTQLKLRDDPRIVRLILLLSDTRLNRAAVRECAPILLPDFPLPSAAAIRALAAGRDPGANAVVLV